jgi:hypothetical protein
MFTNVSVNGVVFQVANMVVVENGFKVVGITSNNTAEEVTVNFSNDFGVVFEPAKTAKTAKRPIATMTVNAPAAEVESPKRGRGRPKGSKNTPKVEPVVEAAPEPIVAAEAAYFGGEDVPETPKRGRGRPRKVVTE